MSLIAKTAVFDRGMKRSGVTVRRFEGTVRETSRRMLTFGRSLVAMAGVAGMGYMIRQTMESIDKIAKMSDELRLGTKALTGWEHAAKISGTSLETLHKGLEIFVRRLGESSQGYGEAVRGLERLKLSSEELLKVGTAENGGPLSCIV